MLAGGVRKWIDLPDTLEQGTLAMKALGIHLIAELYGCDVEVINSVEKVKEIFLEAAARAGTTVVEANFHCFTPHGVSGAVIITESHYAVHTWPEFGYCAVDIFTCGDSMDSSTALNAIKKGLQAEHISITEIRRGILELANKINNSASS